MTTGSPLLLALDLAGTFAFALNGALTAMKVAKVDIVGVLTLGMVTALGGGIIRDVLLGSLPPATFADWRYLLTAAAGSDRFVRCGDGFRCSAEHERGGAPGHRKAPGCAGGFCLGGWSRLSESNR